MKVKEDVGNQPAQDLQEVLKQFAAQDQEMHGHLTGKVEMASWLYRKARRVCASGLIWGHL